MKTSITSSEYELEWVYGSHPRNTLKKIEFLNILGYLLNLHASTTPEIFFSYNATVGLKSVIQNLPTNTAGKLGYYISAGPNLIRNLLWFFLTFFILIGSI